MQIERIVVLAKRQGSDQLILHTNLPESEWPFTGHATCTMNVCRTKGETYARENFPNVPIEVIEV